MKLVRYGAAGAEKPGLVDASGALRDLSGKIADITPEVLSPDGLAKLKQIDPAGLPQVPGSPRLGAPVAGVGKIVCCGLNYVDHAKETGATPPAEPVLFMKAVTALSGPFDPVILPKGATKTDWEVELGGVIGKRASYIDAAQALDHLAGYTICNDVSERAFQIERGGQWMKGKSADTFAPLGPWLVTSDEVPDPQKLGLWLEVNGERVQNGNTSNMIFTLAHVVAYISQFMTLMPGDVVITGTPAGVGLGMKPPRFLKAGDVMRLGIDGLGEQRQEVKDYAR
jgi:2-keto-4-pentenoate hydratase/2-oxohepta-3-ene-1,7-dioic acid hydratase in catechol pathway